MYFTGNEDNIDTRELWERYDELDELKYLWEEWKKDGSDPDDEPDEPFDEEDLIEYRELQDIIYTIGLGYCKDGITLIHESCFKQHAQREAESLYNIPDHWPFTCIDWEQAADDLCADYSVIEFMGSTYYHNYS